jgi:hypothetical protein
VLGRAADEISEPAISAIAKATQVTGKTCRASSVKGRFI